MILNNGVLQLKDDGRAAPSIRSLTPSLPGVCHRMVGILRNEKFKLISNGLLAKGLMIPTQI